MKRVTAAAVFLAMLVGSVSLAWATSVRPCPRQSRRRLQR